MQRFEEGKTYYVNGGGKITVMRRTEHFLSFAGTVRHGEKAKGRKKIYAENLFGLGECIMLQSEKYPAMQYFCFAGHIDE